MDAEHWKAARDAALAAGDLMKAELDRLRAENGALRGSLANLTERLPHAVAQAGTTGVPYYGGTVDGV